MSVFTDYKPKWFKELAPEHQERVEKDIILFNYKAGAMIEQKGTGSLSWIGVITGLIKVSVGNADGRITSLIGVPAGGWIGEGSLLKDEIRRYDVFALRDSVIAKMPQATFEWLLNNSIAFNRFLLEQLNERLAQFIGRTENDRLLDADGRVASCLAELFNPLLYPNENYRLNITQEEIGYLARVSRQRTNQALKRLSELNLIELEYGAVCVLDIEALREFYRN